jgi:hypothetical protein
VSNGHGLSCVNDDSLGSLAVGSILGSTVFMGRIDGDLDSDGATTDFLALEGVDGLLLFGLVTNVHEAVTLALSGPTPPPSDNASGDDLETSVSKESSKAVVVDIETKIGDKENGLGWFADGVLTGGTRGTMGSGSALSRLGVGRIFCAISRGGIAISRGDLSFCGPDLVTALGER